MPEILTDVPDFRPVRVLVVGDVMLDRYWQGDTTRISPEAPVPVVRIESADEVRAGGAANVAVNVTALGAAATLLGAVGDDEAADGLEALLRASSVDCQLVRAPGYRTSTKLRVLSRHQQLIRLDLEDACPESGAAALREPFARLVRTADAVVLSDYGKGALADPTPLIRAAREARKPVLVDPKGTDFERYRGATVVTPNTGEFEAVVGACPDENALGERADALRAELALEALLVTRGEHGMTLAAGGAPIHVGTRAREVYDVTGAGDTMIAVLAASLATGCTFTESVALANVAAGIVVGKLGTSTVSGPELHNALTVRHAQSNGVLDPERALEAVRGARGAGERVVMTNGCFDILHAGHVRYLTEARARGDRLLVAVNDDDSVRRLKGTGRPVNTLEQRMEVLAGLACVDWVVPFSESTPASLIERLAPDVLVKGGDYRVADVAGADSVLARGGEVEILPYEAGCSTSAIIEAIARLGARAVGEGTGQ